MRLRARAPGKVNLCLFLGGLREDGRHEVVTLLESVSLADELELVTRVALDDEVTCPGVAGVNSVLRALQLLRAFGWDAPRVSVTVRKRIPVAAGMGGGSADAAALLRIAQRLDPLGQDVIEHIARSLGTDVPSQLVPGFALGTGAGDEVVSSARPRDHGFLIVPQPALLSTADVYAEADRLGLGRSEQELLDLLAQLRYGRGLSEDLIVNDLQPAAASLYPPIGRALDAARSAGADQALVCGSGPTVAGLFWGRDGTARAREAATRLRPEYPRATVAQPVGADFGFPLFA